MSSVLMNVQLIAKQPANVRSNPAHRQPSNRRFDTDMPLDRTKRVKDARSEAQKEIEEYRNQKETEFKTFEKEVSIHISLAPSQR